MERSLRALVSTRTTQLSPTIAMRAREVAAPSPADLAAAEEELVIVRRHYIPPAPLVTAKKVPDPKDTDPRSAGGSGAGGRSGLTENRRGGRRPRG